MIDRTDDPVYGRNPDNAAILNIDNIGFKKYKEERARVLKLEHVSATVETLQRDMNDIKSLLQQLVNGKTNG